MSLSLNLMTRSTRQSAKRLHRCLHLQSYDAQNVLRHRGLPVVPAFLADTPADANKLSRQLLGAGDKNVILEAQVRFPDSEMPAVMWSSGRTGVQYRIEDSTESQHIAEQLLGETATTPTSQSFAKPCSKVMLSSKSRTLDTFAIRLFPSRSHHKPVLAARPTDPLGDEIILPLEINHKRLNAASLDDFLKKLGVDNVARRATLSVAVQGLWEAWRELDLLRMSAQIGVVSDSEIEICDVSILVDPFALYRQPKLAALKDETQASPLDKMASAGKLFYHKKSGGNIGGYGYGAGVAMATMDALTLAGGKPANFLDGGGGATPANVRAAIELLFADSDVKVIFINSFGGITKTELIAKGLVEILRQRRADGMSVPPIVVRLQGTGSEEAREVIEAATDLPEVEFVASMASAAQRAVELAKSLQKD